MSKKSLWWVLLSVPLLLLGTDKAKAVEYGEFVKKDGKWAFKGAEDPILRFMHETHWVEDDEYFRAVDQNFPESPDSLLIYRRNYDWQRYLRPLLRAPDWVDIGLDNRTRVESYDNPWRPAQIRGGGASDTQLALRSRLRIGLGGEGPVRFFFEGQDARHFFDEDPGDYRTARTTNHFDIGQLFGQVVMKNFFGTGLRTDVHFGRMGLDMGRRRLIGRNEYRNTVFAFDGLHVNIGQERLWKLRVFAVQPTVLVMEEPDRQYGSSFAWGTYLESRHLPWLKADVYYIGLNDQRAWDRMRPIRTYSTFGTRLFKDPNVEELDYELETAFQTGEHITHRGVPRVLRRIEEDHFAYYINFDLGYTFNLPWTPRLVFNYDYASGDSDPNDGIHGTFDSLWGARNFEYMPTGLWGPFNRSNINTPGWRLIVRPPLAGMTLMLRHNAWFLAQSRDTFVGNALRDRTGAAGNDLGQDVELRMEYAVTTNVQLIGGYVRWFKGSYFDNPAIIRAMPAGGNEDSNYFNFSVTVRL
jgi:hypothetical protein